MSKERKLSRAERKEIEALIARANKSDKKELTAQDSIPYQRMYPDGICRVTDSRYVKTIRFQDINYQLSQNEDKTAIFDGWCDFLNYFDSSVQFQLTFVNLSTSEENISQQIDIPLQGDEFDPIREEYTNMLRSQVAKGQNGLSKTKYLTFGIEADNARVAKSRLERIEIDLINNFKRLGVSAASLNGAEYLEVMHDIFNMDEHKPFRFSWKWLAPSGLSTKDFIAPSSFEFKTGRQFRMGKKTCKVSFLQILAPELNDRLLAEFLDMESNLVVSIHVQSVDQTRAIKTIKRKITDLDKSKIEEQKKAVRAGYDMDIIPSDLATYGAEAKKLLQDLQSRNERMFLVTFLIMNTATGQRQLNNNVFQANGIAQRHNCALTRLDFQQEEGLFSCLPLGNNLVNIQRGLTTSSTAIFVPFTTQELYQTGAEALYYGINALSNNLIMVDRKFLKNPNGLILGTPGSGKSFSAKREISNAFLICPDDDIIICDPEGEYTPLVERLHGQVIKISPTGRGYDGKPCYINPMDLNLDYSDDENPLSLKSDFILSLCELIVGGKDGLAPVEKTIIDRCVRLVYRDYLNDPCPENMPVLEDLYTVVDGEVYYRENSIMVRPDLNATAKERVKGMVELRDCVRALIDLQMDEYTPDSALAEKQAELNRLYDAFTAKYGLINDRGNRLAFADDDSYYLLCSLEVLDENGDLERKADFFTKRTIKQQHSVDHVDTAVEALGVSIGERACVDLPFMASLMGGQEKIPQIVEDLRGVLFKDPATGPFDYAESGEHWDKGWQTADEYLSGNVRRKLRQAQRAAQQHPEFQINVEALEKAQPKDLDASEIEVRLGTTWIDKSYFQEFMYELLDTPYYLQRRIQVHYSPYTAEWQIEGKSNIAYNNIAAYTTYGTERASAYRLLEDALNLRDTRIYDTVIDPDGKERRVLNAKETTLAAQKQQLIKDAFKDWIWKDPERRAALVKQYNEEMNSTRPREYDGSHIVFSGMNPEITLRPHQRDAIAHVLYGGNTLLAHEVGAGKTFEMVAAAMESKRLGLCSKSIFVVPNHLTDQWAAEFLRLYPSANILVTTKKDFQKHNRKKFCARIATGDYDAVIIGHSQFEKIPISPERQIRLIEEQIEEITNGIEEVKENNGERFTIKELERTKKGLEARLKKLQDSSKKDDVVTFEQLGVDRMFVDESDNYKNLFLYTKMRNVAGLSTTDAQKSSDMFAKCRYMDELTGGRGVVFATGTPVSNSMTELYTIQRYLQYDRLQELGMGHFDCWASRFGETTTALELAPEGTGYRARTRFAKFFNLPELMNMFKEVADIKTADQLHLPTPEVEYHNFVSKPTEIQKEMVKDLSERASRVHSGAVDAHEDNMLKITSDGRKLGLDQRIINPMLPDEDGTKVNQCVGNILQFWRDGEEEKLTQLVFCDISTPKGRTVTEKAAKAPSGNLDSPEIHALETLIPLEEEKERPFTIYEDIRQKLMAGGMPEEQIAFIHDADTEVRKRELFAKVRSGQVRVLIGSTQKMGAGTNVQDRLIALHDLDCPWRPRDLTQRKGRIERQGNQNKLVHVCRYVTEGTFDSYLWQTVEQKQRFISQIMTSKSPVRSCEDVDETALSFAEIKALCAGDPRIKERMDLDVEVSKLKIMKADHQSKQYRLEDQLLKYFPEQIEQNKGFIRGFQTDMKTLEAHPLPQEGFVGMTIRGDNLTDKENAGAALIDAAKEVNSADSVEIGSYRGFSMSVEFSSFTKGYMLTLKGEMTHRVELGEDPRGNLTRIDNALAKMLERLTAVETQLYNLYQQQAAAKAEVGKPFPYESDLTAKTARLVELDLQLNLSGGRPQPQPEQTVAKRDRPSILERLKQPLPQTTSKKKSHLLEASL